MARSNILTTLKAEHEEVRALFEAGRAKVFAEFVDHHAKEEEKTMFRIAREMFSAEELEQFDANYAEWKQSSRPQTPSPRPRKTSV